MSSNPITSQPGYWFTTYHGYLEKISEAFDSGVSSLSNDLLQAQADLSNNPSDPTYLTAYQKVMSEYNLYRNAQSSSVKSMKDIDSAIVSNFR